MNASRVDIYLADLTAFAAFWSISFLVCAGAPKLGQYKLHFVHFLSASQDIVFIGSSPQDLHDLDVCRRSCT